VEQGKVGVTRRPKAVIPSFPFFEYFAESAKTALKLRHFPSMNTSMITSTEVRMSRHEPQISREQGGQVSEWGLRACPHLFDEGKLR